jgi:serine/threonine protein kinase
MTRPLGNLGAYELLRPLGAGGMAETFVAVRRGPAGFEQRVCLKRILPGCAADPTFVELFLDEARLLARLQCRNIVHVYDFGETEGTYYMALELVEGMDLEGLLKALRARNQRMSPSVALYVTGEVLAALSYAHTLEIDGEPQHIVHRDISPSNILISKNGEVKLTDFGIAKARGRTHRTQTGHTKGKIAYMSP